MFEREILFILLILLCFLIQLFSLNPIQTRIASPISLVSTQLNSIARTKA